jgi:hypothetical protein
VAGALRFLDRLAAARPAVAGAGHRVRAARGRSRANPPERSQQTIRYGRHLFGDDRLLARQIMPRRVTRADDQQDGQHRKADRRALFDNRKVGRQGDGTLDRYRAGKMIGRQDLFGIEPNMCCIGAQEGRDVGGAGQLVEAALLDGFEMGKTNAQALRYRTGQPARFTLVAQQPANRATWRGLAF